MKLLVATAFVLCASHAMADELPTPPIPPDALQVAQAAPVPDMNAESPDRPSVPKTTVDLKLYRAKNFDTSAGFAPGSRFQTSEDRKPIQTPGFLISVPLK